MIIHKAIHLLLSRKNYQCQSENRVVWLTKELQLVRLSLLRGRFYASVVKRSRSGMSKTLKIAYVYRNEIHLILDPDILRLAGMSKKGSISGSGLCLRYAAQYNLFLSVCPDKDYTKFMPHFNDF